MTPEELASGKIKIFNRHHFRSAAYLEGYWKLMQDGKALLQGRLPALEIAAQSTLDVQLPYSMPPASIPAGSEVWLELSFGLAADTEWAARGFELATAQFLLNSPFEKKSLPVLKLDKMPALEVSSGANQLKISGDDFSFVFDTYRARLDAWTYNQTELISKGPALNFWRAPTDNDVHIAKEWIRAGYDRMQQHVRRFELVKAVPQGIVLESEAVWGGYSTRPTFSATQRYSIYGSGDITIDTVVRPLFTKLDAIGIPPEWGVPKEIFLPPPPAPGPADAPARKHGSLNLVWPWSP